MMLLSPEEPGVPTSVRGICRAAKAGGMTVVLTHGTGQRIGTKAQVLHDDSESWAVKAWFDLEPAGRRFVAVWVRDLPNGKAKFDCAYINKAGVAEAIKATALRGYINGVE